MKLYDSKQHINHEAIKTYIMAFFIPLTCVTRCQFYFITFFVLFTKNNYYGMREKKIFLYIWLLQRITLEVMGNVFTVAFLETNVCISNPC